MNVFFFISKYNKLERATLICTISFFPTEITSENFSAIRPCCLLTVTPRVQTSEVPFSGKMTECFELGPMMMEVGWFSSFFVRISLNVSVCMNHLEKKNALIICLFSPREQIPRFLHDIFQGLFTESSQSVPRLSLWIAFLSLLRFPLGCDYVRGSYTIP